MIIGLIRVRLVCFIVFHDEGVAGVRAQCRLSTVSTDHNPRLHPRPTNIDLLWIDGLYDLSTIPRRRNAVPFMTHDNFGLVFYVSQVSLVHLRCSYNFAISEHPSLKIEIPFIKSNQRFDMRHQDRLVINPQLSIIFEQ